MTLTNAKKHNKVSQSLLFKQTLPTKRVDHKKKSLLYASLSTGGWVKIIESSDIFVEKMGCVE